MSLSVPNPSINLLTTQKATVSSPTINSGMSSGTVFDGRGNDFLNPNTIGGKVDDFSGSIRPVTSNTLTSKIANPNPFGKNPDQSRILGTTSGTIRRIMSPSFGSNINFQVPIFNHPFALPVPDLGVNPDPTKIVLSSAFFAQSVQSPQTFWDPRNFNPLIWHNPNSSNILLGTLGAQSSILSGAGLPFPPFNPFPTPGVTGFPFNPFGSGQLTIPPFSPLLSGLGQFGFSGSFNPAMMGNPVLSGFGIQTSVFPFFTQPFAVAGSQPLAGYGDQVGLLSLIHDFTGLMSQMMRQVAGSAAPAATASATAGSAGTAGTGSLGNAALTGYTGYGY